MATHQIAVRLPSDLLVELDRLVATGSYENRAAAVRAGVAAIVAGERRRTIDEQIVAGYLRQPATRAESEAAIASLREAIVEERW